MSIIIMQPYQYPGEDNYVIYGLMDRDSITEYKTSNAKCWNISLIAMKHTSTACCSHIILPIIKCNVLCSYCTLRKLNIDIMSSQVCSWCPISVICRASFCTATFVLDVIGYLDNTLSSAILKLRGDGKKTEEYCCYTYVTSLTQPQKKIIISGTWLG